MRQWIALFAAAGVVAATLPFLRDHDEQLVELLSKAKIVVGADAEASEKKKAVDPPPLTDLDLTNLDDRRDVVTAPAHGRRNADLTLDADYQRGALGFLRRGNVHEGAVVMTDVRTGKVLVWASSNQGRRRDLAVEAKAPSASVFKIVTGSALVEAGVQLNEKFCYSGGERRIMRRDLVPDERRDKYCASLPMAMGRSINTIFARLAAKHLDHETLTGAANRLGWGVDVPFDVPVEQSEVKLPQDDELEFARSAAGFWNTTMTPFQGVNLAQTIANEGEMIRSFIVERVVDEEDEEIYRRPEGRQVIKRVLHERTAWSVARMMEQTVRNGSGFRAFHDRSGRPFLPDIRVAAKTGTLTEKKTNTLFTWFVGFAPARKPEVAFSVLVTNRGPWRVKAAHVACSMLQAYFADQGAKGVRYPHGYRGKKPVKKPDDDGKGNSEADPKKAS
jgi:cell division protein FtsI/penicillin-binding protein 2